MGLRASEVEGSEQRVDRFTAQKIMRLVESNGARLHVHGADAGDASRRRGCRFGSVTGCVALRPRLSARVGIEDSDAPHEWRDLQADRVRHRRAVPNAAYPRWQALRRLSEQSQTLNRWHADDILAEGPCPTRRRSCVCLTGLA
jgi:hypothetical protein